MHPSGDNLANQTKAAECLGRSAKWNSHPELLFLRQQVVVDVTLVQRHQDVLQPVPHTQGELVQLSVHAGLDDCREAGQHRDIQRDAEQEKHLHCTAQRASWILSLI